MGSNRTDVGLSLGDRSLTLESGVDIDESLVSRSPLVRTLAPVFGFFRSRAGERHSYIRWDPWMLYGLTVVAAAECSAGVVLLLWGGLLSSAPFNPS